MYVKGSRLGNYFYTVLGTGYREMYIKGSRLGSFIPL